MREPPMEFDRISLLQATTHLVGNDVHVILFGRAEQLVVFRCTYPFNKAYTWNDVTVELLETYDHKPDRHHAYEGGIACLGSGDEYKLFASTLFYDPKSQRMVSKGIPLDELPDYVDGDYSFGHAIHGGYPVTALALS